MGTRYIVKASEIKKLAASGKVVIQQSQAPFDPAITEHSVVIAGWAFEAYTDKATLPKNANFIGCNIGKEEVTAFLEENSIQYDFA